MNHFENNPKRVGNTTAGASLDKVPAWSAGVLPQQRAAKVIKKRTVVSPEQTELWADPRAIHAPEAVAAVAAPVVEDVPYIEVKQLRKGMPVSAKSTVRLSASRPVSSAPSTVSGRNQPGISMARFLNVNGAVEGMKPTGMRFDLPGRGLSRTLRLWRGTTETATYSSTPL